MNSTAYILIMAALVLMSAYFSATETAFSSLNKTRLRAMVEKGNRRAALAYRLSEQYDRLISTILIGNNIVNIALASLGTVFFVHYYGDVGATISTVVVTVAVLIFGEVTPKSIAKDRPEQFAMFSAPVIRILIWVLGPLNLFFSLWKKLINRLFSSRPDVKMSQEELLLLVDEVEQEGSIDNEEGSLLRNAIEFTDRKAEEILTHRMDLEAVPSDITQRELAEKFIDTQYSRILVYEDSIDNIVGIVHHKDMYTASGVTDRPLSELISPVIFIQKTVKISDLLRLLQQHKTHVAVVLDEYGGTMGIVTMEDILEELVGEIWDEHDEVVEPFVRIDEESYRVDCTVSLEEFCRFFDLKTDSKVVSLGGFVMELFDKVPEVGEKIEHGHLVITVSGTDFPRITEVRVRVLPRDEEEGEEEKRTLSTV